MKKKRQKSCRLRKIAKSRFLFFTRLSFVLTFLVVWSASANVSVLSQKVTLNFRDAELREVFRSIREQTGHRIIYSTEKVQAERTKVTINISDVQLSEALDELLKDLPLNYTVKDQSVLIVPAPERTAQAPRQVTVTGRVTDVNNEPIPGVSVIIKGTQRGSATDREGRFSFTYDRDGEITLSLSFLGMKPVEVQYRPGQNPTIIMEEDTQNVEDVVVTGIYTRTRDSFTGSYSTYSADQLRLMGTNNVLQSLKSLDPSFMMIDNNDFGSDPNRLPDIEIRGKTSIIGLTEEYGEENSNQPLIIIDGFESTLQKLNDMNTDLIESITILKDAASTAIYGSKASNGVIVVESKRPEAGKLRVSYSGNVKLSWADLTDYNLMNATQKLEYEKWSRVFGGVDNDGRITFDFYMPVYTHYLEEAAKGVDSYWLSDPIRFGVSHRHTVYIDGGSEDLIYGVGLTYGNTDGVMKHSNRENASGQIKLLYRKRKISFSNILEVQNINSSNNVVSFKDFAQANPMYRKYDEEGKPIRSWERASTIYYSPLYNMKLNNFDKKDSFGFSNKFEIVWNISTNLRARGRIALSKDTDQSKKFISPFHSMFQSNSYNYENSGRYTEDNTRQFRYDTDVSLTYGQVFAEKHRVNAVGGFRADQKKNIGSSFQVEGFSDDEFGNPNFATAYRDGTVPGYSEAARRSASFYLNTGYSYDNRYLLDVNLRYDGSSIFGVDKHFQTTWSTGVAWNVHNENFAKGASWLSYLKLRASFGNPGNDSFQNFISTNVYAYTNSNRNPFGPGLVISTFGNEDIAWQKTFDPNYGFDLNLFRNRLNVFFDYFHKKTDPLVVRMTLPLSSGTGTIPTNIGGLRNKGVTFRVNYQILNRPQDDLIWTFNVMGNHMKDKFFGIGDALSRLNEENQGANLTRYYDGGSQDDLWAVRSLGIDPSNGREMFLTRDGRMTYVHNYDDEVVVGNKRAKLEGTFGTQFYYKGFTLSLAFRYRLGGKTFMSALYDKVENIGSSGRYLNVDARALTERWKVPGDVTKFRAIDLYNYVPQSSRYVMLNNQLIGESITLAYENRGKWLKNIGASSLRASVSTADIFHISTIKNERGIEYPFERSVTFNVNIIF